MTIKVGDKVPAATFTTFGADGPGPLTTEALFAGKKVALFAVPGAFTPTCSAKHLPSFKQHVADFKAKGDWCEKHNRPDSQCFICHPEKETEFAALYEAKYGEQPPKPEADGQPEKSDKT